MKRTARVLTHYVQMETFIIPEEIANQGEDAIQIYLFENNIEPYKADSRDWEIVDIIIEDQV